MVPRVTVILINYNGAAIQDVIHQSVEAVRHQTYADWELVLVDDGSTDGSDALLASLADGDQVRFASTRGGHRGVGAARNAGIGLSRGCEYLAFVDNDAIPAADWLAKVVDRMDEDPRYGACASRVMFYERPDVINSLGSVLNELAHGTGVGMHQLAAYYRPVNDVMYATGNGMVLRRSALDAVGWFDEGFRFYGHDDSDIGIRLRNAGYRIVQQPEAVLFHLHSTSKREPGMAFWDQRNRVRFALKHYGWRELLWFVRHDLPPHLNRLALPPYVRAWLSASLNQAGSLWRYRWHNRRLGPFIARYQRFYSREHRYVRWPDNRACARQVFPLKELRMGENEEEYLYQGWYNRERWHDEWIRWATPVASLRVAFPQPVHQLEARLILHPALDSLQLTLSAYRWGEPKVEAQCSCLVEQRRQTLMERPPQVRSDQVVSATARRIAPLPTPGTSGMVDLTIPLELPAGEFLLVWQTSEHLTEDGFVPRVIGLGLSELRSG